MNSVILKKFENNILYITKITYEKTDFQIESYYLNLDIAKSISQNSLVDKERLNITRGFNIETFIYDFHLEMAFKIYKESYDFHIEVNYIHFLGFLANNYKYMLSNEFFLNASIITYFPHEIKPKSPKDFVDFLKDHASNYGFFCKDVKGFRNIMFYTALDYLSSNEIKLYDYDFIISFDSIDAEQKRMYSTLDHVVLGDSGKSDGLAFNANLILNLYL